MKISHLLRLSISCILLVSLSILPVLVVESSARGLGERGFDRGHDRGKTEKKHKKKQIQKKPQDAVTYARKQAARNDRSRERRINQMMERSYYQALERDYKYKYSKGRGSW